MSEEEIKEQFQALNDELTGIREALFFFFGSRYEEKIAPYKKILEKIVRERQIEPFLAAYWYLRWIRNGITPLEKQFVLVASLELEEEKAVVGRRSSVVGKELEFITDDCRLKTEDYIFSGGKIP